MAVKISVIIPVYNTEKYIFECLKTLVNQTLKEIEIICVDDMSTDASRTILKNCLNQAPDKIKFLELKKKLGPGGARNVGLSIARGEYIFFVDSDDMVEYNACEKLYELAKEKDADIVNFCYYDQSREIYMRPHNFIADVTEIPLEERAKLVTSCGFLWHKLIKRSLIQDNRIVFRENCIYEDVDFLSILHLYAQKFAYLKEPLYFYRDVKKSSSRGISVKNIDRNMRSLIKGYSRNRFKRFYDCQSIKEAVICRILIGYGKILNAYMLMPERWDFYNALSELRDFVSPELLDGWEDFQIVKDDIDSQIIEIIKLNQKDPREFINLRDEYLDHKKENPFVKAGKYLV